MFDIIMNLFTTLFETIYSLINSLVYPIIDRIIVLVFPQGDTLWFYANEILTQFFFKGASFVKVAFCNIAHVNYNVMAFAMGIFALRVLVFFSLRVVKFGLNLYSLIKVGRGS